MNGAGGNQPSAVADRLVFDPVELTGPMAEGKKGWWDVDLDVFESVLRTNTMGTVVPSRVFAKQMDAAGGGAIVTVSSMWGVAGASGEVAYSASKAAVIGMTKALAKELAELNKYKYDNTKWEMLSFSSEEPTGQLSKGENFEISKTRKNRFL